MTKIIVMMYFQFALFHQTKVYSHAETCNCCFWFLFSFCLNPSIIDSSILLHCSCKHEYESKQQSLKLHENAILVLFTALIVSINSVFLLAQKTNPTWSLADLGT